MSIVRLCTDDCAALNGLELDEGQSSPFKPNQLFAEFKQKRNVMVLEGHCTLKSHYKSIKQASTFDEDLSTLSAGILAILFYLLLWLVPSAFSSKCTVSVQRRQLTLGGIFHGLQCRGGENWRSAHDLSWQWLKCMSYIPNRSLVHSWTCAV